MKKKIDRYFMFEIVAALSGGPIGLNLSNKKIGAVILSFL